MKLDRAFLAVAATAVAVVLSPVSATAATYTQFFPTDGLPGQARDARLGELGWCGGHAGDPVCENRPGQPNADNDGGEGRVSQSAGSDGDAGFAFWSTTRINADSWLFTESLTFDSSDRALTFDWWQRDSDTVPSRMALRVAGDWYVSDQSWRSASSSEWENFSITLGALTFANFGGSGTPGLLPGGTAGAGGALLPAGTVDAWGFVWDGRKSATSRLDTITVSGDSLQTGVAPVPLPAPAFMLLAGVGGLAMMRRRKRS